MPYYFLFLPLSERVARIVLATPPRERYSAAFDLEIVPCGIITPHLFVAIN